MDRLDYIWSISLPSQIEVLYPKYVGWFIAGSCVLVLYLILRLKGIKSKYAIYLLLTLYVLFVLGITLIGRSVTGGCLYEIKPFWSYMTKGEVLNNYIAENIFNVLLFVPIGIIGGILSKRGRCVVISGLIFSIMIELAQLVTHRGFCETDDVIHNTLGTVVGVGICMLVGYIFHPSQTKKFKTKRNQI